MPKKFATIASVGVFVLSLFFFTSCTKKPLTHDPMSDAVEEEMYDPCESVNRNIFSFNDSFYNYVFFPIADTYGKIMPLTIKDKVSNFFHNLATPIRVVGDLLQLKGEKAIIDASSAVFNTSFGILGIFDIYAIDDYFDDENVSQGFASWGISDGPYIVWPFIGPSNVRNTVGSIGDLFFTPQGYLGFPDSALAGAVETTNAYGTKNPYREIIKGALDPYTAIRDAYRSNFNKRLE